MAQNSESLRQFSYYTKAKITYVGLLWLLLLLSLVLPSLSPFKFHNLIRDCVALVSSTWPAVPAILAIVKLALTIASFCSFFLLTGSYFLIQSEAETWARRDSENLEDVQHDCIEMALRLRLICDQLRVLTVVGPGFVFEYGGPGIRERSEDRRKSFMSKLIDLVKGPEDLQRLDPHDPAYDYIEHRLRIACRAIGSRYLSPEALAEDFQNLRAAIPTSHRTPHLDKLRAELDLCSEWLNSLCVVDPADLDFGTHDQQDTTSNLCGYKSLGSGKSKDLLVKDRVATHIVEAGKVEGGVVHSSMRSELLHLGSVLPQHGPKTWLAFSVHMYGTEHKIESGETGLRSSQKLLANLCNAHSEVMDIELELLSTMPPLRALALGEHLDLLQDSLPLKPREGYESDKVWQLDFERLCEEAERDMGFTFDTFHTLASCISHCPQDHSLKMWQPGGSSRCDECQDYIDEVGCVLSLGCRTCGWNVCFRCAMKAS
eukprot:TRINITY_DN32295_c0_g1_i1.p1 TRINITY_DN32295_c0_g1~~TRINITY_DN32295_c0_g1_i1.p1  ORF type:complete len:534 (-),score=49.29 TRINITY_DN32295_c0_g1_i1:280-1740(-)